MAKFNEIRVRLMGDDVLVDFLQKGKNSKRYVGGFIGRKSKPASFTADFISTYEGLMKMDEAQGGYTDGSE